MDIKFQYNKISLQNFRNAVKVRLRALPVLRAKEAALRVEVKTLKQKIEEMKRLLEALKKPVKENMKIWSEFPDLVSVEKINIVKKTVAGVPVYAFEDLDFHIEWFSVFQEPKWFLEGIRILKEILTEEIRLKIEQNNLEELIKAGKKTTQKVNLYEKIQIPAYQKVIVQIRRFLEDEENLSRAGQKIMKKRKMA